MQGRRKLPVTPIAICVTLILIALSLWYLPPHRDEPFFSFGFFDKLRLLQGVAPPRVILIGGSNVSFAFDSSLLKAQLHKNVINDGVQIGFGLYFLLNAAEKYLKPGDLVVICPECEQFFGVVDGNESLISFLIWHPELIKNVRIEQMPRLLLGARTLLREKVDATLVPLEHRLLRVPPEDTRRDASCRRDWFDSNGDIKVNLERQDLPPDGMWVPLYINISGQFDNNAITRINSFARSVAPRNIRVIFTYPLIAKTFYESCRQTLQNLELRLRRELKVQIVGTVESNVMPDECFYDTRYHPLTRYKVVRTRAFLKQWQECQQR